MTVRFVVVSCIICLMVCQCTPNSDVELNFGHVDKTVPGSWSNTKQAKRGIDSNWINSFGDSQLNSLVKLAWKNSPEMVIAAANVQESLAIARASKSKTKPKFSIGLSGTREESIILEDPIPTSTFSTFSNGINANWELDIWSKLRNRSLASKLEGEARVQMLKATKASLAARVAKVWFSLREKNAQIVIAHELLQLNKKIEMIAALRLKFGYSTASSDIRLSQIAVAKVKSDLATLELEKSNLNSQLKILLGSYSLKEQQVPNFVLTLKKTPPVGLPSELLLRRPDILSAERQYSASLTNAKASKAALYPSFSLTGLAGIGTNQLKNILDSEFGVWQIGANLTMPLINRGELKADLRVSEIRSNVALVNLHSTVIKAFVEVDNALSNELIIKKRLNAMKTAEKVADQLLSSAQKDYDYGQISATKLLDRQQELIQLKSQLESLKLLRLMNRIDLHLALGGDV